MQRFFRVFFYISTLIYFFPQICLAFSPINILPNNFIELNENAVKIDFEKIQSFDYISVDWSYLQNNLYNRKKADERLKFKFVENEINIYAKPFKYLLLTYSSMNEKFNSGFDSLKYYANINIKNQNNEIFGVGIISPYIFGYLNKNFNDDKYNYSHLTAGIDIKKYLTAIYLKKQETIKSQININYKNENLNVFDEFYPEEYGLKIKAQLPSFFGYEYYFNKSRLNDDLNGEEINNEFNSLHRGESESKKHKFYITLYKKIDIGYKKEQSEGRLISRIFEKTKTNTRIIQTLIAYQKNGRGVYFDWRYSNSDTENFISIGLNNSTLASYGSGYFDASYYINFFLNVMAGNRAGYFNFDYDYSNIDILWSKKISKRFRFNPSIMIYDFKKFRLYYDYYEPLLGGFLIKNRKNKLREYDKLIISDVNITIDYIISQNLIFNFNVAQIIPIKSKEKKYAEDNADGNFLASPPKEKNSARGGFRFYCALKYKY